MRRLVGRLMPCGLIFQGAPVLVNDEQKAATDFHGYYVCSPGLPGCQSQGATFEETLSNIREAVELYVETLSAEERKLCCRFLVAAKQRKSSNLHSRPKENRTSVLCRPFASPQGHQAAIRCDRGVGRAILPQTRSPETSRCSSSRSRFAGGPRGCLPEPRRVPTS
jgi:predicted RNase H-like HicB family nuclease